MSRAQAESVGPTFAVQDVRADFPILTETINGHPLVYLDNAATTQKPNLVIDTINDYYRTKNANIHRGVHTLSQLGTDAYEAARGKIQRFLNAASADEIIFTRGTTEAINLAAHCLAQHLLEAGDEIIVLESEHHSNIVPWQMICARYGTKLVVVPIDEAGQISLSDFEARLSPRTKIAALGHVSNALGTINPAREMTALAHAVGAIVLLDGAQAVAHTPVDVQAIGCDLYAFSGHKLFGPTGIGALYGKRALLDALPPYQGGGDMIREVRFDGTEYNDVPYKFEAGTPNIAGAIGLGAAIDYINGIDFAAAIAYEDDLLAYATARLTDAIDGVQLVGTAAHKAAVLSFNINGIHPQDIGLLLDNQGIAVRTGHHCAMPVMQHFGLPGTVRASLSIYNTRDDIDRFIAALTTAHMMLA